MSKASSIPDEILFASVQEGDHAAFQQLFDRYWEEGYRLVWKKTGSQDEAKDLVQDLFIYLWTNAARIHLRRSFRSYLFAALKYKVINYYVQAEKYAFVDGKTPRMTKTCPFCPTCLWKPGNWKKYWTMRSTDCPTA